MSAWAQAISELSALLNGFAAASLTGGGAADELAASSKAFSEAACDSVTLRPKAALLAEPPTDSERQAACRGVQQFAERLAALGWVVTTPPPFADTSSPVNQQLAAWAAVPGWVALAEACQMPGADVAGFCSRCAQQLVMAGAEIVSAAQSIAAASSGGTTDRLAYVCAVQLSVMRALFQACTALGDALFTFLDEGPPPSQFAGWLGAVAQKLLISLNNRQGAGQLLSSVVPHFVALCHALCRNEHAVVCVWLQADQLMLPLQLLLNILPVSAISLRLPAERRPAWCTWSMVYCIMDVLAFELQRRSMVDRIRSLGVRQEVVRALAQLLSHAPLHSEQAGMQLQQVLQLLVCTAKVLELFLVYVAMPQQADLQQTVQAAELACSHLAGRAAALLPVLQRLPRQLQFAISSEEQLGAAQLPAVDSLCSSWNLIALQQEHLLKSIVETSRVEGRERCILALAERPSDLARWCDCGTSAIKALSQVAAAAQWLQAHGRECTVSILCSLAENMVCIAATTTGILLQAADVPAMSRQLSSSSGASKAATETALLELHSTGCKLAHYLSVACSSSTCPTDDQQQAMQHLLATPHVTSYHLLYPILLAARKVTVASWGTFTAASASSSGRWYQAICAAHWEAVQGLTAQAGPVLLSSPSSAPELVFTLAAIAEGGPAATALRPALHDLLHQSWSSSIQGSMQPAPLVGFVLGMGGHSPHLATALLTTGMIDLMINQLHSCWMDRGLKFTQCPNAVQAAELASLTVQVLRQLSREIGQLCSNSPDASEQLRWRQQHDALTRIIVACSNTLATLTAQGRRGSADRSQFKAQFKAFCRKLQSEMLPQACQAAAALQEWWQLPEQLAAAQLELAHAAATRSCAYLRCANLSGEGGPLAGQGVGSQKCSVCRAVWYCGATCSHPDWRQGGHRRVCTALAAERQQKKNESGA